MTTEVGASRRQTGKNERPAEAGRLAGGLPTGGDGLRIDIRLHRGQPEGKLALTTDEPKRVLAYLDGFSLYHGLRAKGWKHLYWLDLRALVEAFVRP